MNTKNINFLKQGTCAFTLAEGGHSPLLYKDEGTQGSPRLVKRAFTLAEVLITLGVIGVVAAMTLPTLVTNIQNKVREKRIENIHQKLSKVTDKMAATSDLRGYESTEAFVNEMKKHMSIAKICDNNHLAECWPTPEVNLEEDKTWEMSKTKTAKTLKISQDGWDDTVGIITGDGTAMILSYDKNCAFNPDNGFTYNNSSGKSNSLVCLSGVYDWNGSSRPNKLGDDVTLLGMASGLGSACAFEVGTTCYTAPFTPTPMSKADCEAAVAEGKLGIKDCYYDEDYWAGAVEQCGGTSKMPTMAQLGELASQLYKGNPTIGAKQDASDLTFNADSPTYKALNSPNLPFYIWSGEAYSGGDAYRRSFRSSGTGWSIYGRNTSGYLAVCLGD